MKAQLSSKLSSPKWQSQDGYPNPCPSWSVCIAAAAFSEKATDPESEIKLLMRGRKGEREKEMLFLTATAS